MVTPRSRSSARVSRLHAQASGAWPAPCAAFWAARAWAGVTAPQAWSRRPMADDLPASTWPMATTCSGGRRPPPGPAAVTSQGSGTYDLKSYGAARAAAAVPPPPDDSVAVLASVAEMRSDAAAWTRPRGTWALRDAPRPCCAARATSSGDGVSKANGAAVEEVAAGGGAAGKRCCTGTAAAGPPLPPRPAPVSAAPSLLVAPEAAPRPGGGAPLPRPAAGGPPFFGGALTAGLSYGSSSQSSSSSCSGS